MRLVPLAGRAEDAVRIALLSHGWEGDLSSSTAAGLEALAFQLSEVEPDTLQALLRAAARLGVDVVTGSDWALLAGARARLSALARPWNSPEDLAEVAAALGHAMPGEDPLLWQTARGALPLEQPVLLGILNVTPDSFSDGGRHNTLDAALAAAEWLLAEGATILDVGGESTRPDAVPVSEAEELARVLPVIAALAARLPDALISVDSSKAAVAREALRAGAAIVNDVSGFRFDPALPAVCAEYRAGVILMHSRGAPGALASLEHAQYPEGVLSAVTRELARALGTAQRAGIPAERIVLDPGLGFGKTVEQNLEVLRGLGALRVLGRPLLVGPSRKRFLGSVTGRALAERDVATAMSCGLAWEAGARLFRVHEPGPAKDALALARALRPR